MRRVAVVGVGVTRFGKHDRSSAELFAEAARDALADAEMSPASIQALYYGNVVGGETEKQLHTGPQAASANVRTASPFCTASVRESTRPPAQYPGPETSCSRV